MSASRPSDFKNIPFEDWKKELENIEKAINLWNEDKNKAKTEYGIHGMDDLKTLLEKLCELESQAEAQKINSSCDVYDNYCFNAFDYQRLNNRKTELKKIISMFDSQADQKFENDVAIKDKITPSSSISITPETFICYATWNEEFSTISNFIKMANESSDPGKLLSNAKYVDEQLEKIDFLKKEAEKNINANDVPSDEKEAFIKHIDQQDLDMMVDQLEALKKLALASAKTDAKVDVVVADKQEKVAQKNLVGEPVAIPQETKVGQTEVVSKLLQNVDVLKKEAEYNIDTDDVPSDQKETLRSLKAECTKYESHLVDAVRKQLNQLNKENVDSIYKNIDVYLNDLKIFAPKSEDNKIAYDKFILKDEYNKFLQFNTEINKEKQIDFICKLISASASGLPSKNIGEILKRINGGLSSTPQTRMTVVIEKLKKVQELSESRTVEAFNKKFKAAVPILTESRSPVAIQFVKKIASGLAAILTAVVMPGVALTSTLFSYDRLFGDKSVRGRGFVKEIEKLQTPKPPQIPSNKEKTTAIRAQFYFARK